MAIGQGILMKYYLKTDTDKSELMRGRLYDQLDWRLWRQLSSQLQWQLDRQLYWQLESQLWKPLYKQLERQLWRELT